MDVALEHHFNLIASYVALAIECGAVFVVAFDASQAIAALLKAIANGQATGLVGRQIWLRFATWILLALEFALAADILRTAVAPTWDDISKLAVIATIRTMLNYFLAKDIMAFAKSQEDGPERGAIQGKMAESRTVNQMDWLANMWFSLLKLRAATCRKTKWHASGCAGFGGFKDKAGGAWLWPA